jgi:TPR repeat protein
VTKDEVAARNCFHKAAQQGYAQAQFNLGGFFRQAGDLAAAVPWLRKAAEQGLTEAIRALKALEQEFDLR